MNHPLLFLGQTVCMLTTGLFIGQLFSARLRALLEKSTLLGALAIAIGAAAVAHLYSTTFGCHSNHRMDGVAWGFMASFIDFMVIGAWLSARQQKSTNREA